MITCNNEKDFAGKGIAGTGLGLGIAGTALGLLAGGLNGGNGLGGILGGNTGTAAAMAGQAAYQNEVAKLREQVATLTAQKYSDNADVEVYKQTRADNKTLRDEVFAYVTPIAQESAANRERVAVLEAQVKCETEKAALREEILRKDIAIEKQARECCCNSAATAIAGIQQVLEQITKIGVPNSALCPGVPAVSVIHPTTTTA